LGLSSGPTAPGKNHHAQLLLGMLAADGGTGRVLVLRLHRLVAGGEARASATKPRRSRLFFYNFSHRTRDHRISRWPSARVTATSRGPSSGPMVKLLDFEAASRCAHHNSRTANEEKLGAAPGPGVNRPGALARQPTTASTRPPRTAVRRAALAKAAAGWDSRLHPPPSTWPIAMCRASWCCTGERSSPRCNPRRGARARRSAPEVSTLEDSFLRLVAA